MAEIIQRLRTCKAFLNLAWLALWTDSVLMAVVVMNSVRDERDAVIVAHKKDGTLIDPEGMYNGRENHVEL